MTQMLIKYQLLKNNQYGSNKSIKYFIGYNDNDDNRPLCIKVLFSNTFGRMQI